MKGKSIVGKTSNARKSEVATRKGSSPTKPTTGARTATGRPARKPSTTMIARAGSASTQEEIIRELAEFPDENPFPILRIDHRGTILYANPAAQALLECWKTSVRGKAPKSWLEKIKETLAAQSMSAMETTISGRNFLFKLAPNREENYVNLYGEDITERKLADAELRQSEARYRGLFENMAEGFAYCKMIFENGQPADWIYLAVNDAFVALTGLKDIVGKRVTEAIPGIRETDSELFEAYARVSLTGKAERFENYVEALDMWFSVSVYSPQKEYFVAAFDVITERKRAEESLQQATNLLETIFAGMHTLVAYLDSEFNFLRVNQAYAAADNQVPEYFPGKNHFALYPNAENQAIFEEVVRSGNPYNAHAKPFEYAKHPKRGVSYWDWTLSPIKDEQGKVANLVLSLVNVTERKRSEEALRHSQEQLLSLVEQAPLNIAMFDREMRYIAASQRWVAEYGQGAQNLVGLSHYELNPSIPERWKEAHRRGLEGESLKKDEDLWLHDDGTEEWLRWAIVPWRDAADRIGGIILSVEDITERKRAEALQDAVYRIAKAAETSQSLNDLYPQIHQIISSVMQAENFYITLYDEKQDVLRFPYFKDALDEPYLEEIHPGMGLTAYVLRTGQSLLCTQATHDELERQGAVKLLGVPSKIWLGVPLTVGNKTIGAMVVQHYSDPQAYGEREQHILEFVSSQVAVAIQRKRTEEALQRRADELSALQAVVLDMTTPRPLNEALETIAARAVALLDGTSGGMYLAEPEQRRVRCVVSYKTPKDYTGTTLAYGEGAAGRVAESGEPLLIDDYRAWSGRAAVFAEEQSFEAVASVPLLSKGQVVGVIHVIRERKFSREELRLLSLFANHATVAVERARLLNSVRENEERYRLLFENTPVGILSVTPQGQILEVNPNALQILGSPSAEATKQINMLTFPPLVETGISADLQRCTETRQPLIAEHFYTTKWGKAIYVHYQMVPIPNEGGEIGQVQLLIEDITERRQAEEARIASEKRFKALIENGADLIVIIDEQGVIQFASPSSERIMGYRPEETIGKNFIEWVHPDDLPLAMESLASRRIEAGTGTSLKVRNRHKDGSWRMVEVVGTNLLAEPSVRGIVLNIRDITERERAEEAVIASEKRFKALIENGADLIMVINAEGVVQFASPSVERIMGYRSEELVGQSIFTWVHPDDLSFAQEKLAERLLSSGTTPISLKTHGLHKNGSWRILEAIGTNLLDEAPVQGIVLNVRDISEREQAEVMQEAVYRISEAAQKVTSQEELFREVQAIIGNVMPANNFYIALYDEARGLIRYPYYMDEQDGLNPFPDGPLSRGLTEYVLRTGTPLLCDQARFDELAQRGEVELVGAPSLIWLGVPLTVGNRAIGIMAVQDYSNPLAFGERELRMLEYVSDQAARVIERQLAEEALREKEERYRGLFEDSPISLWEEDFSGVKKRLEALRQTGITDLAAYLESHPDQVVECAALVRIVDVNKATLKLYHAEEKEDLLQNLTLIFRDESYQQFREELCYIAEGRTHFEWEGINQGLDGEWIDVNLSWSIVPGHEEDLARVIISIVDITERKRAEKAVLARKAELEALFSLSTRLSASQTEQAILPIVLEEMKAVFETDGSAVMLLDAGGEQFATALADGPLASTIGFRFNVRDGAAGQVFRTRQPMLVKNFATFDGSARYESEVEMLGPSLFAPIESEDQFLGVLLAARLARKEAHPFGEDATRLLSVMGQMVGNALRRARLLQQALGRLNHLQGMQNINTVIANSLDLNLSLNVLLKEVCAQMEIDAAAAYTLDANSLGLNFTGGNGLRTHILAETRLRLGESCAGTAALEQRLVSAPDIALVTDPLCRRVMEREDFVSEYAYPMIAKGKARGILEVFHRKPYTLDSERESLLKALAGQAALAIDNIQLFNELQDSNFKLAMAYDATIEGWSSALDLRDKETEGHTQRVTDLTLELARAMGVPEAEMVHLRRGALLHDIGKMGVPDQILLKPGELTDEERALMQLHPLHAYNMLSQIQFLHPALDIPHYHHERWDGSGYPDGLTGERIPLHARLFAVVDVWDALTSDRWYRKAWTEREALNHIREQSGKHFDPQAVEEFLKLIRADNS